MPLSRRFALALLCLLVIEGRAVAQTLQPGQTVEVFAYGNWGTIGRVKRVDASGVLVLYRAQDGTYNESTGFARYFRPSEVRLQGSVPAGATGNSPGGLGLPSAQAAPTPGTSFKVGDRVEGWNIAWYKGTVVKVGVEGYAGSYLIKHDDYAQDSYYKEASVRRLGAPPTAPGRGNPPPPSLGTSTPKTGSYGCGVFLSGRFTPTQTVTLEGSRYTTTHGGGGDYTFDPASRRLQFQGGALADQVGQYEPDNKGIFRLTQRKDLGASEYTQKWRSQVCSPR